MKSYTFPYYIKFGKGDISEGKVTCSLSEKDALKLEKSARWGGRFHLDEDDEIEYIYDKVFNKVIAHETDILLKNPEIVESIVTLSTERSGWTKELNLVSFNDAPPKYDLRTWDPDHIRRR